MSRTSTGSRHPALLLLRWSWRDLRARWVQVAAIALVIALGTGSYAGLSSVTRWRANSTDAAYAELNMHDLRVTLPSGAFVDAGSLAAAAREGMGATLTAAEERLVVDTQVDASTESQAILVPGIIYGLEVAAGGPAIDQLHPAAGSPLAPADAGEPVVMLEGHFASYYDLPPIGTVRLAGGAEVRYTGHAITPEYFIVTTDTGALLAEASFAAIFTSLETAQQFAGRPGQVNSLVVTLQPGADREAAKTQLAAALADALPGLGTTVETREEDEAYRLNNRDIDGDQQFYNIFAGLIFAGAVVAAFNLIARIVESQRREIGLAMVLGFTPARIAVRPLLVAAEIALLGVIFGVGVGMVIGGAMASVLQDVMPLPSWDTSFQVGVFAVVALAGFLLPFLATAWPVWRAVTVPPVDAVRPAYRSGKGGGLARIFRRIHPPGNTFWQMPIRNVVRSPRRTLLTCLGIAAALAALVAFVGLIDSFLNTVERGEQETVGTAPDRLEVGLEQYYPEAGPQVAAVREDPAVAEVEAGLRVEALLDPANEQIGLRIEVMPLDSELWRPTLTPASLDATLPGIYISELAARNLGVGPGDTVQLQHPVVDAATGRVGFAISEVTVLGTHPHPFRFIAYMDRGQAAMFGLAGAVNLLRVLPAEGVSRDDVKRALFDAEGVSSIEGVGEVADALKDLLDEFVVVLRVVEFAMVALALLMAFNAASINVDERTREHATMFAFGVPVWSVLRMAMVENLVIGIISTIAGLIGGWLLLEAILATRIPDTLPEVDVQTFISPVSLAMSILLGVVAVTLAPVLTLRKLRRINVPASLKVME